MLLGTVAWSFVSVSLPFHVRAISDVDAAATLRWTGFILGITALTTVATAPAWGWLGERADSRRLFILTQLLQGSTFLVMAAVGAACVPLAWRGERAASIIART